MASAQGFRTDGSCSDLRARLLQGCKGMTERQTIEALNQPMLWDEADIRGLQRDGTAQELRDRIMPTLVRTRK